MTARASIREGETVAAPLKTSGVFPPMVVQMISVGEQTGALDEMLTKIAVFYEAEVDTAVDTMTSVHRADHDRPDGRHRRRHGGGDVSPDVQADQRGVGWRSLAKAS